MKAIEFLLSIPLSPRPGSKIHYRSGEPLVQPAPDIAMIQSDLPVPFMPIGDYGFVIGVVFSRQTNAQLTHLPHEVPLAGGILAISSWLMRECWGGYVAIFVCPLTNAVSIFVDPSGLCPVYCTETSTHILIATHIALLADPGNAVICPSYAALHSYLVRSELRQRQSCLNGVTELRPGEVVTVTASEQRSELIWRPENFMPSSKTVTFEEAAEELARVAGAVCKSWGELFGKVTVAASGGVDSSLICAALATRNLSFSCATVATLDPSGDERRFVRMLAGRLNVEIVDAVYDLRSIDPLRSISEGLPRPSKKAFMAALEAALFAAAAEVGTDIVFDGNSGDNLFCFLHSSVPVIDRIRQEGVGRGTFDTFHDMCLVTGCDIRSMARATIRRLFRQSSNLAWLPDHRLLSRRDDSPNDYDPLTPWLDSAIKIADGKKDHLALIMRSQLHVHGLAADGLPRFSPLASQPLVEYCLGVPTWLWCAGGKNRAVARAAFANRLPREIVERTSKAGPDSFIHSYFKTHAKLLRELLMDGLLAHHEVIDREAVNYAFKAPAGDGENMLRLLDLCEAECWSQSWSS
jgi:asparagine synthase (glutamine-hydrolysing)